MFQYTVSLDSILLSFNNISLIIGVANPMQVHLLPLNNQMHLMKQQQPSGNPSEASLHLVKLHIHLILLLQKNDATRVTIVFSNYRGAVVKQVEGLHKVTNEQIEIETEGKYVTARLLTSIKTGEGSQSRQACWGEGVISQQGEWQTIFISEKQQSRRICEIKYSLSISPRFPESPNDRMLSSIDEKAQNDYDEVISFGSSANSQAKRKQTKETSGVVNQSLQKDKAGKGSHNKFLEEQVSNCMNQQGWQKETISAISEQDSQNQKEPGKQRGKFRLSRDLHKLKLKKYRESNVMEQIGKSIKVQTFWQAHSTEARVNIFSDIRIQCSQKIGSIVFQAKPIKNSSEGTVLAKLTKHDSKPSNLWPIQVNVIDCCPLHLKLSVKDAQYQASITEEEEKAGSCSIFNSNHEVVGKFMFKLRKICSFSTQTYQQNDFVRLIESTGKNNSKSEKSLIQNLKQDDQVQKPNQKTSAFKQILELPSKLSENEKEELKGPILLKQYGISEFGQSESPSQPSSPFHTNLSNNYLAKQEKHYSFAQLPKQKNQSTVRVDEGIANTQKYLLQDRIKQTRRLYEGVYQRIDRKQKENMDLILQRQFQHQQENEQDQQTNQNQTSELTFRLQQSYNKIKLKSQRLLSKGNNLLKLHSVKQTKPKKLTKSKSPPRKQFLSYSIKLDGITAKLVEPSCLGKLLKITANSCNSTYFTQTSKQHQVLNWRGKGYLFMDAPEWTIFKLQLLVDDGNSMETIAYCKMHLINLIRNATDATNAEHHTSFVDETGRLVAHAMVEYQLLGGGQRMKTISIVQGEQMARLGRNKSVNHRKLKLAKNEASGTEKHRHRRNKTCIQQRNHNNGEVPRMPGLYRSPAKPGIRVYEGGNAFTSRQKRFKYPQNGLFYRPMEPKDNQLRHMMGRVDRFPQN